MSESLDIDSPLRGRAMPRSYSGDLRERVIDAVEKDGASRREAAERFDVSVSSAVKWLQRWSESRSAAPKPRGGSVSPLEAHAEYISLVAERPDLTLKETLAELLKRRIRTSKSALSRFFARHDITFKKTCKPRNGIERKWPACADAGYESKACLIPPGWCLSMRLRLAPIWCD
jgi:transposase